MTEIITIILEYAAIWAPSLVSVAGVITTVLLAIGKTKNAAEALKNDVELANLAKETKRLANENEELVRCNKLLLDNITKIKDYADQKKEE